MMNIFKILIIIVSIILVVLGYKKDKVKLKEVGLAGLVLSLIFVVSDFIKSLDF
ncbi:hypothetical protein [Clostridium chrysemydis]|uniref:hypothetical protein n=1 Tax=Clostridium chrysemydis TaxID=2665504 RepID=UPI0018848219|nr:hypothetical protein [Clostridium chrysemydis]